MATYEFDGISTEQFNEQDKTEKFYEMYDGTKRTFYSRT